MIDLKVLDKIFLMFWGSVFFYFCVLEGEFKIRVGVYPYHWVIILLLFLAFRLAFMIYLRHQNV